MSTPFLSTMYTDWRTIAVLAASVSVIGSVALIMFSRLFDLKSLEQNAKTEFVYAASTVFIVLAVIGLVTFGDTVIVSIAKEMYINTVTYCPPSAANTPICQQLEAARTQGALALNVNTMPDLMKLYMEAPAKCSQDFLNFLYVAAIPIDACASLYMEVFMSEQLTCFGLKFVSERITNAVQGLTFYMFAYYLIGHTLEFIKYYAGFFFSIGVAMRAFPPTRGAGAYLMAITVGLYFVFPFSYVMITTMALPHAQSSFMSAAGVQQSAQGGGSSIKYACGTPAIGDVTGLDCGTGSLAKQLELLGWLKANRANLMSFFDPQAGILTGLMTQLTSVICVFPLVAFAILFTFVLNTTNLFGGNIPEIGRGLVRLI